MKRYLIPLSVLLALVALATAGNRIAGRILDAQLAPLLTRELGLPVSLGPITASLGQLKARTPTLVMGRSDDPAVTASEVEVRLAWSDLIRGEIRLVAAAAAELMVRPSRWPANDGPPPDDFRFLDPWLPADVTVGAGRYVGDSGEPYPLRDLAWRRERSGGANARWLEDRAGGTITVDLGLDSLPALLDLEAIELGLTATPAESNGGGDLSARARFAPQAGGGYRMEATLGAAGSRATVTATNSTPWQLPSESRTRIDRMEPGPWQHLFASYARPGAAGADSPSDLDAALPRLKLPDHAGTVTVGSIQWSDELFIDTAFDFIASPAGVIVRNLASTGPSSTLAGHADIRSGDAGWDLSLEAALEARASDEGIAGQFLDAEWLWETGRARFQGSGATWEALLYSLDGEVALGGVHRGETLTPVSVSVRLTNRPGDLATEALEVHLGEARITGHLSLSGTDRRILRGALQATGLDLDFLFRKAGRRLQPGVAIPEYLLLLPDMDLDLAATLEGLRAPGLRLAGTDLALTRGRTGARLQILGTGPEGGGIDLLLESSGSPGHPDHVKLAIELEQVDLDALFAQQGGLYSRTTGTAAFESRGRSMEEVFRQMRGRADLTVDIRPDNDWQRTATAEERLQFGGNASLVVDSMRIFGVAIEQLEIASFEQELTGTVSLVAGREPWIVADLESRRMDIDGLIALLPDSAEAVDRADVLTLVRNLGALGINLRADQVILRETAIADVDLEVSYRQDRLTVSRLNFSVAGHRFEALADLRWKGERAAFTAKASTEGVDLDRFVFANPGEPVPVSGTVVLASEGGSFSELLSNLSGDVDLAADPARAVKPEDRRRLAMTVRREPEGGMHASIEHFEWGESDLAAEIRYRDGSPARLAVEILGANLSLLPWEEAGDPEAGTAAKTPSEGDAGDDGATSAVAGAARASASFLGNALRAPLRLFSSGETVQGERLFSQDPLPFDQLGRLEGRIHGRIDSVTSQLGAARDLDLDANLAAGQLDVDIRSKEINKGRAQFKLVIDSGTGPPGLHLVSSFQGIHGPPERPGFPRSGYSDMKSYGSSEAELAANLSGQSYLELGEGLYDVRSTSLLTADLMTSLLQTLIPGLGDREPTLECAVTLGTFRDGIGITPFGYAVRTREANLLGRMEIDLRQETIRLRFDSRSREGVGLSVGNVFSNTVQVEGPLANPRIVPNPTGLLWRGWAAFMTAGISVIGESVVKRALASRDPCEEIKQELRKKVCGSDQPAAASPLVCPPARS